MKPLITKDNLKKAYSAIKEDWPNPYNLTKKDAKGCLENWPLEVITLALLEAKLLRSPSYTVKDLQSDGIVCAFSWYKSRDGLEFWDNIDNRRGFDDFYKVYTPSKLKERLENETT